MLHAIIFFCALSLSFSTCFANAQSAIIRDGAVEVQLIADSISISPGDPFWVALRLKADTGWHTYWKNPGDSGTATRIQWVLPENFKAGPIEWPYPHKIEQPPLTSYGYDGEIFLLTKITPPQTTLPGEITIKAKVDWLMCKVECIPGKAELEIKIPLNHQVPHKNMPWIKNFTNTQALPLEHSDWSVKTKSADNALILELSYLWEQEYNLTDIYFFPERDELINHADPQKLRKIEGGYNLSINRSMLFNKPLTKIKGVLYSKEGWRGPGTEKALSVNAPIEPVSLPSIKNPSLQKNLNLITVLFFAFIGGLILNLMPCVLPVLSLKILGFMKQNDPKTLRTHGLVFTAGILTSFWILAGTLMILRAAGQHIGWGFQFQSPVFLIFLSAVFLIFALNLFGIFEILLPVQIQTPKQKSGLVGVFLNGALATITATPCTAPFMGTAISFALTQSPLISLGIFTSLGAGMSFPYILLSFFPPLLKCLPKPGPWMNHFKKFLGVLLLGTVLWLWWILAIQLGGKFEWASSKTPSSSPIQWQSYSSELIQQLRSQNKMIFINFTAKWCLTCQVNKKITLENLNVVEKFKDLDVVMINADWTLQDVNITKALAEFGRNSIPLYVLFGKKADQEPMILPEILTPKIILDALKKISNDHVEAQKT